MAKSFQERLGAAKDAAGFTLQDLAAWFGGVSYQAVSTWLNGRLPKAYRRARIERALEYLEREIKAASRLPIPMDTLEGERRAYVRRVRSRYPAC